MDPLREEEQPLEAPTDLSPRAAKIWDEVVASKPSGWFDAGSAELLHSFCEVSAHIEALLAELRKGFKWPLPPPKTKSEKYYAEKFYKLAGSAGLEKRINALASVQATLATKLRLSVQYLISRHSRKITDAGVTAGSTDTLLGGDAVIRPGKRRVN
jgi:hypothetical protein